MKTQLVFCARALNRLLSFLLRLILLRSKAYFKVEYVKQEKRLMSDEKNNSGTPEDGGEAAV